MTEYDFTLRFDLRHLDENANACVEKLYARGCDDALIGTGKKGRVALNFLREADSAYEAIKSAIADVKSAFPDTILIEAAPDFVSLTEIARLLGCSPQKIEELLLSDDLNAPIPIYEGTRNIWRLAEVFSWLHESKSQAIDEALLEVAKVNMNLNNANSFRKVDSALQDSLIALII